MITEIPYTVLTDEDCYFFALRPSEMTTEICPTCGRSDKSQEETEYDICSDFEEWFGLPYGVKEITICISDEFIEDAWEAYKDCDYADNFDIWSDDREFVESVKLPFAENYRDGATRGVFWIWIEYEEN